MDARAPVRSSSTDITRKKIADSSEGIPAKSSASTALIQQVNYPVQELGGLVFAYLGPSPAPELPRWDVLVREDGTRRAAFARFVPSNWLQLVDNHQDPAHTTWLHKQMQLGRKRQSATTSTLPSAQSRLPSGAARATRPATSAKCTSSRPTA